jgi:RNase P subunit RPR2
MRRLSQLTAVAVLLVAVAGGAANAAQKKGYAAARIKAPKCSKCKMSLSPKKTTKMSEAVKIGKRTWYCCSACGAHKNAAAGKKAIREL